MLGFALALVAASPEPGVLPPGNETCQRAMQPDFRARAFDYVMGAWTGMNMASNKQVGKNVDIHLILKDVAMACVEAPQLLLAHAVLGVHMRYERQGR